MLAGWSSASISQTDGQRLAVETWQECKFQGGTVCGLGTLGTLEGR